MDSSLHESNSTESSSVSEYSISIATTEKMKFNVMRFNHDLNIDFTNWNEVKLERENNRVKKKPTKEIPKSGVGSERRIDKKMEERLKRLSFHENRYNPDVQPYLLELGGKNGKNGKKFRGTREGGVTEHASYYAFMLGSDNHITAYPISEWYNFVATDRFKTSSAKEAEQELENKIESVANVSNMARKRIHNDDGEDEELEDEGKHKEKKMKENKKKVASKKRKVINDDDESAVEESDEEGPELDHISDSSESVSDEEMEDVAEQGAFWKLLTSDKKNDEGKSVDESNKTDAAEEKNNEDESAQQILQTENKENNSSPGPSPYKINEIGDSSRRVSADITDSETEKHQAIIGSDSQVNCKMPLEKQLLDPSSNNGITEEAVRRYLARKPMTATELLQKFKKQKTNLGSDQLVNTMAQILKEIKPIKQTINNKLYFSVKGDASSSH